MTVLSIREIYDAARDAGFTPHQAVTWTSIAMAESGGRTTALNAKGEHSVGLWQINVASGVRANKWGDLHDPENNARAAYEISRQGRDMRPWTTTHDSNQGTAHDYRHYLDKVEDEIGVQGDPRGVGGYHSAMLQPLEKGSYDQIDAGKPLAATTVVTSKDSDGDGLTDEFEKLAGTDPKLADTDGDGLADGYEALSSKTDPLATDSDNDGVSDPAELAAGTDAGHLPGTAGVVGSGPFAENVRNGVLDSDSDGLSDHTEKLVGTDPNQADTDADGLSDATEASLGTNPTLADSDYDGISDGLEVKAGTDPLGDVRLADGSTAAAPRWTLEGALADRNGPQQPATAQAEDTPDRSKLDVFLKQARDQRGDTYLYGSTPKLSAKNPSSFDCSSLTQWAANKAGVKIPRTAEYQYMDLKQRNLLIPVDEAIKTPGALLFYFSREPTSSLPAGQAHVAISKGDGKTIEAKGRAYGVGEFSAKHRFNYAGVIPGISDAKGQKEYRAVHAAANDQAATDPVDTDQPAGGSSQDGDDQKSGFDIDPGAKLSTLPGADEVDADTDHDGLTDAFEKLVGSNPTLADTDGDGLDDGYEATTSHTDPLSADTDGDGLSDPAELAAGSDPGRLVGTGGVVGTGAYAENVRNGVKDADGDGLSDRTEKLMGTKADVADSDADGLSDSTEAALGTNPLLADTDGDGMSDGLEVQYHSDPLVAGSALGGNFGQDLGSTAPGQEDGLVAAASGAEVGHGSGADAFDHG
ncbi:MAG TPA: NlpC/P60 family protein [Propionibacteriaceae bacterium]